LVAAASVHAVALALLVESSVPSYYIQVLDAYHVLSPVQLPEDVALLELESAVVIQVSAAYQVLSAAQLVSLAVLAPSSL